MEMTNTTTASSESISPDVQRTMLKSFDVVEILFLALELWLLISLIVYGTKTGRWRNTPQSSSLNNGVIYVACAVTMLLNVARLTSTVAIYKFSLVDTKESCEILYDISFGVFAVATWGSYGFVWLRQRMIYRHPYVRPKVLNWVDWFSLSTILFLTINTVGIGFTLIQPESYQLGPMGCVLDREKDGDDSLQSRVKISHLLFSLFVQFVLALLFVYPAKKVLFQPSSNKVDVVMVSNGQNIDHGSRPENGKLSTMLTWFGCSGTPTSPIHMSVRRTMFGSFIMVIADIVTTTLVVTLPLSNIPPVILTIYDIAIIVHSFCIIATFSFSSSVFTLFWPRKLMTSRRRTNSVIQESYFGSER